MIPRLLLAIGLVLAGATAAAAQPLVFLVRHAERADGGKPSQGMMADDPDLSSAGHARAQLLARMLKDAGITAIYTTEFKRTRQTAAPLAKALALEPVVVASKDVASLVDRVRAATGSVLVVGHSNTVPDLIARLDVKQTVTIAEQEFDNLYIVVRGHAPTVVRLHY